MGGLFGGGGSDSPPPAPVVQPAPVVKVAPVVEAIGDEETDKEKELKKVKKGVGTTAPLSLLATADTETPALSGTLGS